MSQKSQIIRMIGAIQIIMAAVFLYVAFTAELGIAPVTRQLELVFESAEESLAAHKESYQLSVFSALKLVEPMEYWGNSIKGTSQAIDQFRNFLPAKMQELTESISKTGDVILEEAQTLRKYGEIDYPHTINSFDETAALLKTCNETIKQGNGNVRRSYCLLSTIAGIIFLTNGIALCLLDRN